MSTIIIGDVAEGSKWWSQAHFYKLELARLYASNNAFMQLWKHPVTDIKIHVIMRAGQPVAFIYVEGGGYMESGFLDWQSAFRDSALTYTPASVRFNEFVTSNSRATGGLYINASSARSIEDFSESFAIGCRSKETSLEELDEFGNVIITGSSPIPTFCSSQYLYGKKLAQALMPASVFTGKMRKYVQAMYGAERDDYKGKIGLAGPTLTLTSNELARNNDGTLKFDIFGNTYFETVDITPYAMTGAGIAKIGNTWVLIEVSSVVSLRKLNPVYKKVTNTIPTAVADTSLIECYELATLVISEKAVVIPSDVAALVGGRQSVAYGWHFSSDGLQAVATVREEIPLEGNNQDGSPSFGLGWHSALLKLDFSIFEDSDGNLSGAVSTSTIEEGDFFPLGQHFIYYPEPIGGDKMLLAYAGNAAGSRDYGYAPLYAWFDKDNQVKVARIKNGTWGADAPFFDPTLDTNDINTVFNLSGCWTASNYTESGSFDRPTAVSYSGANVTIGPMIFPGSARSTPVNRYREYHIEEGLTVDVQSNFSEVCGHVPPYPDFEDVSQTSFQLGVDTSYRKTISAINHSDNIDPIVIIPFGDANSIFIGSSRSILATLDNSESLRQGGNMLMRINGGSGGGFCKLDFSGMTFNTPTFDTDFPSLTTANEGFIPNERGNLYLYNDHATRKVYEFKGVYSSEIGGLDLYRLSHPSDIVTSPWFSGRIEVITSINGASIWRVGSGAQIEGRENWPVSIIPNSTGPYSPVGFA